MINYKNRILIFVGSIFTLFLACVNIFQAYLTKGLLQSAIEQKSNELLRQFLYLVIAILFGILCSFVKKYSIGTYSIKNESTLRLLLTKKLINIEINDFEKQNKGTFLSLIINNIQIMTEFYRDNFVNLIYLPVLLIGTSIYLIILNAKLFLLSFILIPLFMLLTYRISKRIGIISKNYYSILGSTNTIVNESFTMSTVIKIFNLKNIILNKARNQLVINQNQGYEIEAKMGLLFPILIMIYELPGIICIIYGSYLISRNEISVASLIVYIQLLSYIINPIVDFSNHFVAMKKALGARSQIKETLALKDESSNHDSKILYKSNSSIIVEFKDVKFGYNQNQEVLKNINFSIQRGEVVAIVGESGSGKSTINNILCGFYHCKKGEILFCGENIDNYSKQQLREKIAVAFQQPYLFSTSIYNNILYGNLGVSSHDIEESAINAYAIDFIEKLKSSFKEEVDENGKNLSGGQQQRIELARSFIKDSELLILDEPTALLDTISEGKVVEYIYNIAKERKIGVLITSHRLNTIKNADKILVLKKGKIVAQGKHVDLIEQNNYYASLLISLENE